MDNNNFTPVKQALFCDPDIQLSIQRAEQLEKTYIEPLPDGFHFEKGNLIYQAEPEEGKEPKPPIFICSRLDIVALTCDIDGNNHGRLLEFTDAGGMRKQWAMPMELLAGDGTQFRAALLSMGLRIGTAKGARGLLNNYILQFSPKLQVTCVGNTGWHDKSFVLPDVVLGQSQKERLILQTASPIINTYTTKGTLEGWKQHVAVPARGNSRLLLALSAAFAAPLLHWTNSESGGLHFCGPSSCGKTTALRAACSVWGGKEYMQLWRTTANGLEVTAAFHNDTLLCLDELGQIHPEEAGEAAYLLCQGLAKGRAERAGQSIRKKHVWRLLFLSTGELSLSQHMLTGGKKVKAGQEVRLIEIPADTGVYGMFETIHGFENGKAFAEALDENAKAYYGTAGRTFLSCFLQDMEFVLHKIRELRSEIINRPSFKGMDGQVGRVLNRFVLIACAGEIATSFGITGWEPNEATDAVLKCFNDWIEKRGGIGPLEEKFIISQVKCFFEQHGESRFAPWEPCPEHKTLNRAGFRKLELGEWEFYVFPETFKKDICNGLDPTQVAKICAKYGLLQCEPGGGHTRPERLPGIQGTTRCYRFTSKVLGGEI